MLQRFLRHTRYFAGIFATLFFFHGEIANGQTGVEVISPPVAMEYWSGTFTISKEAFFVEVVFNASADKNANRLRFVESGKDVDLTELVRTTGHTGFNVKGETRTLRFNLTQAGHSLTGDVTSGTERGKATFVRILKPDLARDARAIGAYQTSDGNTVTLKMMSDFPHLSFLDYTTGRFGALFAVGERTYQAGPANLLPVPAAITLTLSADFTSLVWEEKSRTRTAKRIALTETRTKFRSGSNMLGGTLILPTGKGPFPAIVLTQTSASSPRDAYYVEAYFFAARGIAAFIYDKRGVGESGGVTRDADIHGLADDAIAAGDWLASQPTIDATRIGVWGQSQGGWIAPLAASKAKRFNFVIAQAAAGVTPAEQEVFRVENLLRTSGLKSEEIAAGMRYQKMLMRWVVENGVDKEAVWALARAGKDTKWAELVDLVDGEPRIPRPATAAMFSFDPIPWIEKLRVPTYFLWGDRDSYVPVQQSEKLIRAALARAGNSNAKLAIYPDTAHGWWETREDSGIAFSTRAYRYSPNYFRDLGAWLDTVVAKK